MRPSKVIVLRYAIIAIDALERWKCEQEMLESKREIGKHNDRRDSKGTE